MRFVSKRIAIHIETHHEVLGIIACREKNVDFKRKKQVKYLCNFNH